jgi:hypothetical protein
MYGRLRILDCGTTGMGKHGLLGENECILNTQARAAYCCMLIRACHASLLCILVRCTALDQVCPKIY